MARTQTLAQLRSRTLLRADMVNSAFRTSTTGGDVDGVINAQARRAYNMLVSADGDYFLSSADITTISGQDVYTSANGFPADLEKLKGVDCFVNGITGASASMRPFRWHERNKYQYGGAWTLASPIAYRLRGASIVYAPKPVNAVLTRLWYYPSFVDLTTDAQTLECPAGMDELIVLGAAVQLCSDEADTEKVQVLQAQFEAVKQEFLAGIATRDTGGGEQAMDLYANDWWIS